MWWCLKYPDIPLAYAERLELTKAHNMNTRKDKNISLNPKLMPKRIF